MLNVQLDGQKAQSYLKTHSSRTNLSPRQLNQKRSQLKAINHSVYKIVKHAKSFIVDFSG